MQTKKNDVLYSIHDAIQDASKLCTRSNEYFGYEQITDKAAILFKYQTGQKPDKNLLHTETICLVPQLYYFEQINWSKKEGFFVTPRQYKKALQAQKIEFLTNRHKSLICNSPLTYNEFLKEF